MAARPPPASNSETRAYHMYDQLGLFIDGEWRNRSDGGKLEITDPATGEVIGTAPSASLGDVESAIASADKGLKVWRTTPAWSRADVLHATAGVMQARADEIARRITLEMGKPIAQSRREWALSIDQFRWYAEEARR